MCSPPFLGFVLVLSGCSCFTGRDPQCTHNNNGGTHVMLYVPCPAHAIATSEHRGFGTGETNSYDSIFGTCDSVLLYLSKNLWLLHCTTKAMKIDRLRVRMPVHFCCRHQNHSYAKQPMISNFNLKVSRSVVNQTLTQRVGENHKQQV